MHPIRAISAIVVFATTVLCTSKVLGTMRLNEVMSMDEQKKTGVATLSDAQKKQLESWINDKFVLKPSTMTAAASAIYLEQNMQSGAQLMFNDGSIYEIAPTDRSKTVFWLTPIEVTIEPSGDQNYPAKITNSLTKVSVTAKMTRAPKAQIMTPQ
jgi:Mg/Co/Ni transporter MgtE